MFTPAPGEAELSHTRALAVSRIWDDWGVSTWRTLRVIGRLKWVLLVRHYRRNWGNAIGVGASLLTIVGASVVGGALLFVYLHTEGQGTRDSALLIANWLLALLWLMSPFTQLDLQRNLDLNGLRLLPLSGSTFTFAVLLDGVLSPIMLFTSPALLAALACFTLRAGDLAVLLLSGLLLLTFLVGLCQALYLWLNRLLTSRRFADASIFIGLLLFVLIQGVNLYMQGMAGPHISPEIAQRLAHVRLLLSPLIDWLPPGLAMQAVSAASGGFLSATAGYLALLAAQAVVAIWLAGVAARQFYAGELESGGLAPAPKAVAPAKSWRAPTRLLGPLMAALLGRERVYLARDPLLKALFIQTLLGSVMMVAVLLIMRLRISQEVDANFINLGDYSGYALLGIAMFLSFAESAMLFNKFGYEGPLVTATLLTPVSRVKLLAAKSVFLLSHFAAINVVIIAGLGLMLRVPPLLGVAAVLMVAANTAVVDVIGHFVSIYFPFTYQRRGRRMRAVMAQPGCGYTLLYMLVFQLSNLAVLPLSAALAGGAILGGWGGLALGALLAASCVTSAYYFGLPLAAAKLAAREPELLTVLNRTTE